MDLDGLMKAKSKSVSSLTGGIAQLFKKNQITHINGHGTIKTNQQVIATKSDGSIETINTKYILIATGSEVTPFQGIPVRNCAQIGSRIY